MAGNIKIVTIPPSQHIWSHLYTSALHDFYHLCEIREAWTALECVHWHSVNTQSVRLGVGVDRWFLTVAVSPVPPRLFPLPVVDMVFLEYIHQEGDSDCGGMWPDMCKNLSIHFCLFIRWDLKAHSLTGHTEAVMVDQEWSSPEGCLIICIFKP